MSGVIVHGEFSWGEVSSGGMCAEIFLMGNTREKCLDPIPSLGL